MIGSRYRSVSCNRSVLSQALRSVWLCSDVSAIERLLTGYKNTVYKNSQLKVHRRDKSLMELFLQYGLRKI